MRLADVKTGVLYAYQQGKYGILHPVVVLDTRVLYVTRYPSFGAGHEKRCISKPRPDYKPRIAVNDGCGLVAATNFGDGTSSYEVRVGRRSLNDTARDLLRVTMDDALRMTIDDTSHHRPIHGHTDAYLTCIDPRYILGEWDEVTQQRDEEAEIEAAAQAEEEARKAAVQAEQTARWERVEALGVPGPFPHHESRLDRWMRGGLPEGEVRLTNAQFDALLSLIPEGAKIEEAWEYPAPEGASR